MPQESLLALAAIVTIVIGAVAFLEGSTSSGRDDGDKIVDSVRGLLEETGALAAARAVNRLLANRPIRQARRPRSMPVAYPPTAARASAAGTAPSVAGVASSAGAARGIDEEPTEAWSMADASLSGDRPPTQPNRIIVSGVRTRGRAAGLLRRNAAGSVLPPGAREGAIRPGPVSTRLRRRRSLSGTRLLQALSAVLLVALLVLLAVLILRPAGDSSVLAATSAPSNFLGALPSATPMPTATPTTSPSSDAMPSPGSTPSPTAVATASRTPSPTAVLTAVPTAGPTPQPPPGPTPAPTPRPPQSTPPPTPKPTPNPTPPPATPTPTPSPAPLATPITTPSPTPTEQPRPSRTPRPSHAVQ